MKTQKSNTPKFTETSEQPRLFSSGLPTWASEEATLQLSVPEIRKALEAHGKKDKFTTKTLKDDLIALLPPEFVEINLSYSPSFYRGVEQVVAEFVAAHLGYSEFDFDPATAGSNPDASYRRDVSDLKSVRHARLVAKWDFVSLDDSMMRSEDDALTQPNIRLAPPYNAYVRLVPPYNAYVGGKKLYVITTPEKAATQVHRLIQISRGLSPMSDRINQATHAAVYAGAKQVTALSLFRNMDDASEVFEGDEFEARVSHTVKNLNYIILEVRKALTEFNR